MRVQIVCYEDPEKWICGKIARRLADTINGMGHQCKIAWTPDDSADINHHVIYLNYPGTSRGVHTLMVTHIDEAMKLRKLATGLETARAAICMSASTVAHLSHLGLPAERLTYAHPAHDRSTAERRIVIGIATRLYPDGRKREGDLVRLSKSISPRDFTFKIMGYGWGDIVADMRARGFAVEYWDEFHFERYVELLGSLDYFLYLSGDEGSMGYIDALAAGVKTIVQPQGFHLDAPNGITHAFTEFEELKSIFEGIAAEKRLRQAAVSEWTWENYARQHLTIWNACLENRPLSQLTTTAESTAPVPARWRSHLALWRNAVLGRFRLVRNIGRDFDCESKLWQKK